MSKWANLINPFEQTIGFAKAPFEQRKDNTWLGGTVRNFAHAGAGDALTGHFEQKYLGDTANGYYRPQDDPANQQVGMPGQTVASAAQGTGLQGTTGQIQDITSGQAQPPQQAGAPTRDALLAWMKMKQSQQGGLTQ